MKSHQRAALNGAALNALRSPFVAKVRVIALTVPLVVCALASPRLAGQARSAQSPVPQWQIDAGGKMAFDVASVKQNLADGSASPPHANVQLDPTEKYTPTGGLFSVGNMPLTTCIAFAYKLTPYQLQVLRAKLPGWAASGRYDIEARAAQPNPTKDQMRLMLQSLLADRFKVQVHMETRQIPVFVMTLAKVGKLGPQLVPHTDNPPCAAPGPSGQDDWPMPVCGALLTGRPTEGRWRIAYRDASMHVIADALPAISMQALDRPVLDQTGLSGTFDLRIEFAPQRVPLLNGAPFPNFTPNEEGPTFLEALQEQLGLKLESQTGPVDVLVIDHIEQPSPN
jgi:uncharacterized protein (TIGR03435 family)